MDLLQSLRLQARANRLANHRLHRAMAALSETEFHATRVSFFPSLAATLNHILMVDRYYLDCLEGRADARDRALGFAGRTTLASLVPDQVHEDERFIARLEAASAASLEQPVQMPRRDRVQTEALAHVVLHLLQHQVHHRGQVHAMLSGTAVAPPQLDEFLMRSEAHLRTTDLAELGWTEADLFDR